MIGSSGDPALERLRVRLSVTVSIATAAHLAALSLASVQ
jgi:hypothetical protein